MKKIVFFAILALCYVSTYSQAPEKVSYQAVIRDASGNVRADVNIVLQLSILHGSATGTAVYTESHNVRTSAFGLVNLALGGGTVDFGTFNTIDWAAGPYFVKVKVDGVEYGTSQVLSVPYALYAKKAANGFSGTWADLTGKPTFAAVATSGAFADLLSKPTTLAGYGITDADGSITNELQTLSLSGTQLTLSNTGGTVTLPASGGGDNWGTQSVVTNTTLTGTGTAASPLAVANTVITPSWSKIQGIPAGFTDGTDNVDDADNSITNEIQALSLSGTTLSLSNGGGSVTLPSSGTGDNWGTQAVVTNNTLTGTGTAASPLAVANSVITPTWANIQSKPVFSVVATSGTFADLLSKPTTLVGYGITDAVTITGNQTITGIKTFSNDLSVSGLTIGNGKNAVSSNTANGYHALYSNTTGYDNTAIGYAALYANTEGYRNTANGYRALQSNTTGYGNSANGYHALYANTEGYSNTANGYAALSSNTTGDSNTANGYAALKSNTTGYFNTANGYYSLFSNTEGSSNTANGYSSLFSNTTGDRNTANGFYALDLNTEGEGNTAHGYGALYSNTTGNFNTAIGYFSNVTSGNLTNATALGNYAIVNASNKVRIGNSDVTVIEGQVNWSVGSDRRLKENIEYSDKLGLEFVNGLKTTTFTYKNDPAKRHHDGLIAQDVKETLDKLGMTFSGLAESDNEEKTFNLSYAEFVIPLINSVKELNNKNQGQQNRIEDLQKEINELKYLVNSLIANQTVQGNK